MDAIRKQDFSSMSFSVSEWQKVETTLKALSKESTVELDIHVSKKHGGEVEIRLQRSESVFSNQDVKTFIHVKPGLYDLFW